MNILNQTLLSLEEASNFLKIKKETLYTWVHQRKIPFRKHGRKLVFSVEDLTKWSESKKIDPID